MRLCRLTLTAFNKTGCHCLKERWKVPHYRTKNHNILILSKKRFAKSFYCKTALQAVLCLFQQKYLKNCPVVWESSLKILPCETLSAKRQNNRADFTRFSVCLPGRVILSIGIN